VAEAAALTKSPLAKAIASSVSVDETVIRPLYMGELVVGVPLIA
jgi:hypothetical protein